MLNAHVKILKNEYDRRHFRNRQYSLRSYARDLSVTPSWLSEVLRCKKGVSKPKAEFLAEKLVLKRNLKSLFVLSAEASHSRSPIRRELALAKLKTFSRLDLREVTHQELSVAHTWYFNSILELLEFPDCTHRPEWFAKKLGLPIKEIRSALEQMVNLRWVTNEDGRYRAWFAESETTMDVPSSEIAELHRQHLKKAEEAIFEQTVREREFLVMSLAFDKSKIAEAKKFIRNFQNDFAEKFYSAETKKNSVYQLSVQFLRLDREGETN